MSADDRQRGFVALAALCMLAMIAGLAAAAFHTMAEARRAANRAARQEEAASAADIALHAALESWDLAARESLAVGTFAPVIVTSEGDSAERPRAVVARLSPSLYWIAALGRARTKTSVEAIRSRSLLVETLEPAFSTPAALVARGDVTARAAFRILGGDSPPPGWADCPPGDPARAPAIILGEGRSGLFEDGRPIPNVHFDSAAIGTATSGSFGRVAFGALVARGTFVIPHGAILSPAPDTGGDCQLGRSGKTAGDWGDPGRTGAAPGCESFYPVVAADGDLTLRGGKGQGVLLVRGRLLIEGPFAFHGVIFAFGRIVATGSDISIYGTVMSASTNAVTLQNEGVISRSTCAVGRAAAGATRAYPVPHRAWAELY